MIDVLYILGKGSIENNEELRYSLRSLDKYAKNVGRIFITGECPDFVKDVIYTRCDDPYSRNLNHFYKVYTTFMTTDISDNCILMYDDIFLCREVDAETYPWCYTPVRCNKDIQGAYTTGINMSYEILRENGNRELNFACHTPCIYNRSKFCGLEPLFNHYKEHNIGISPRIIYGNLYAENIKEIPQDVKVRNQHMVIDEFIVGKDCFSSDDYTFNGNVKDWLESEFKTKSRWEK